SLANSFSLFVGTGPNLSAQSHDRAIYVRRSQSAHIDGSEYGISAGKRALFIDRHAYDPRRVFSYLSNQASADTEVADCLRRGLRTSSPSQFRQTKFIPVSGIGINH